MYKSILLLVICLLFPMSIYASDDTNIYIDENVFCATGNATSDSIEILAVDEDSDYFMVVIEGVTVTLLHPNEYGWALVKYDTTTTTLEKGKEYYCYVMSYKDGEKTYSKKNSFVLGK